jgi:hypothetical protein
MINTRFCVHPNDLIMRAVLLGLLLCVEVLSGRGVCIGGTERRDEKRSGQN